MPDSSSKSYVNVSTWLFVSVTESVTEAVWVVSFVASHWNVSWYVLVPEMLVPPLRLVVSQSYEETVEPVTWASRMTVVPT